MARLPAPRSGWIPAPLRGRLSGWWQANRMAGSRTWPRSAWAYLLGETVEPFPGPPAATETEAMGLPPFGRGMALLGNAVASTDWWAQRWDADQGVEVRLADQPLVLTDPYPLTTVWNYKYAATWDGILYGNHFALFGDLDWRTLRPGAVVPIPADEVWMILDASGGLMHWTIGGETFAVDEIFHVSFGARSGELLGLGVLAQYGPWLGGAVAAEEHAAGYFAVGDADTIVGRIGEYVAAGISKFVLRPLGADGAEVTAQTQRLIAEVLPQVASRWPKPPKAARL